MSLSNSADTGRPMPDLPNTQLTLRKEALYRQHTALIELSYVSHFLQCRLHALR